MKHVAASWAGGVGWIKGMIKVASMSLGAVLGLYSRHLKYLGIVHRVVEESGGQSVYIQKLND